MVKFNTMLILGAVVLSVAAVTHAVMVGDWVGTGLALGVFALGSLRDAVR